MCFSDGILGNATLICHGCGAMQNLENFLTTCTPAQIKPTRIKALIEACRAVQLRNAETAASNAIVHDWNLRDFAVS